MLRLAPIVSLVLLTIGAPAWATLSVFVDDNAGYTQSASAAYSLIGLEGFEDNTLTSNMSTNVALVGYTPTAAFPNGLTVPATITAPSGVRAHKELSGENFSGTVVGTSNSFQTLTLSFNAADDVKAVGMNVLTPFAGSSYLTMSALLWDNTFVSQQVFVDDAGTAHIGFMTDALDSPIRDIYVGPPIISGTANRTLSAIDNVSAYTFAVVPEPSQLLAFGLLGMAGGAAGGRRK